MNHPVLVSESSAENAAAPVYGINTSKKLQNDPPTEQTIITLTMGVGTVGKWIPSPRKLGGLSSKFSSWKCKFVAFIR